MDKKLYIMRGIPGAGKSYTMKKLLAPGGQVFSTDSLWGDSIEEYKANFDQAIKSGNIGKLLGQKHAENLRRSIEAMDKGITPVIIDNTNVRKADFAAYVHAGLERGYDVEFVEPESPWWIKISEMLKNKNKYQKELDRWAEYLANKNEHGVPLDTIKKMMQRWESNVKIDHFR